MGGDRILKFWGFHYPRPFGAKFGMPKQTHRVLVHAKFHLDRYILSPLRGKQLPKCRNFNQICNFGDSCAHPVPDVGRWCTCRSPAACDVPAHQTRHGDRGGHYCTSKLIGIRRIVSPLGSLKIWGKCTSRPGENPITPKLLERISRNFTT